jgi:hypothetical protein
VPATADEIMLSVWGQFVKNNLLAGIAPTGQIIQSACAG